MPAALIPFLLLFIPILEITVFILVGGQIGVPMTLAMILLTAIIGSILLRIQGFSMLARIQGKMQAQELPGEELVNGVMILIAGVLLLTPGFVTDSIGFLLFFPPFRKLLWATIASKVIVHAPSPFGRRNEAPNHPFSPDIIDLDATEFSETPNPDSPWNKDEPK